MFAVFRILAIGALGAIGWMIGKKSVGVVDRTINRAEWLFAGVAVAAIVWLIWKGR